MAHEQTSPGDVTEGPALLQRASPCAAEAGREVQGHTGASGDTEGACTGCGTRAGGGSQLPAMLSSEVFFFATLGRAQPTRC